MSNDSARRARTLAFCLLLLAAAATVSAQERLTGRFFVKLATQSSVTVSAAGTRFSDALDAKARRWSVARLDRIGGNGTSLSKGDNVLARFVLVTLADASKRDEAMNDFASDPAVEYVEPEHILHVDAAPNDSAWASQWGMQRIGMEKVWEGKHNGSLSVRIGIIDTGIDYDHPDFRFTPWIGSANPEDVNSNGSFEPWPPTETRNGRTGDLDGIDNDGNGFVDDVIGYDFVDQPGEGSAAGGDHSDPDSDPLDEMGHGTSVAGIIAARTGNSIGVAGITSSCRLMILRAFDARGVGAEGDVARCLAYAVDNGSQVINMSFGDTQYSRVLRDMVRYAYGRGVTMVASAGNSGNADLHYPSAYDETISVGATASNDNLAGFSNYGATVDLVAPGQDIITTERNGLYGSFSGTSASAPFVTGIAALIKSEHRDFGPEEIRGVLIASAEDLGPRGWDDRYGSGLLNAAKAVEMEQPTVVKIIEPKTDRMFGGDTLLITGTAASPLMTGYTVEVGTGINPSKWTTIAPYRAGQVIGDTLAVVLISSWKDTSYTIRLSARSDKGVSYEDRSVIAVKRTPPRFLGVGFIPAIDGRYAGVAVGFITDEPTLGKAFFRVKGAGEWQSVSLEGTTENNLFVSGTHYRFIGRELAPGQTYEFYLSAVNQAGRESIARDGIAYFELAPDPPITEAGLRKKPYSLPLGRLFPATSDFNGNGRTELLFNNYEADSKFEAREFDGSGFSVIGGAAQRDQFPRGFGTLGAGGVEYLLSSFVRKGFLYEREAAGTVPSKLVWADSVNQFWPVTIADVNNDGVNEVLAVVNDSTVGVYQLAPSRQLTRIGSIVNPTHSRQGRNVFNSPRVAIGDFNRNGKTDLLFGDSYADFFIVESRGGGDFATLWGTVNDYVDGGDYVAAGDFDGDGRDEFAIGFRTAADDVIPYWYFGIYRLDASNKAVPLWSQRFFGIEEASQYGAFTRIQNSLTAGNVDGDPAQELIISVFPELYVVDFDAATQSWKPAYALPLANSNAVTIADFDGNGVRDFAFAEKDSIFFYERDLPYAGPPLLRALEGVYLSDSQIRLSWYSVPTAPRYRLYKGADVSSLQLLGTLLGNAVSDFDIVTGRSYVYAVTTYDSTLTPAESPRMLTRVFHPHARPMLDSAVYLQNGQVKVRVTQDMGTAIPAASSFLLNDARAPESVALLDQRWLLLSFDALSDGSYGIRVKNLRDAEGVPFDDQVFVAFEVVNSRRAECFIERVDYVPPRGFDVLFSMPVQSGAGIPSNYVFEALGPAASATLDPANKRLVHVEAAKGLPIGAIGREYVLKVSNVLCAGDVAITTGAGSSAGVVLNRQTLDDMFVFPNPLRASDAQELITFANLTARATIRIYSISGTFLKQIEETDGNGGLEWNLQDEHGNAIPAGIYIYYATGFDTQGRAVEAKTGKFAVAR